MIVIFRVATVMSRDHGLRIRQELAAAWEAAKHGGALVVPAEIEVYLVAGENDDTRRMPRAFLEALQPEREPEREPEDALGALARRWATQSLRDE